MLNPWAILAAVVTAFTLLVGSYAVGRYEGKTLAEATYQKEERAATVAYENAMKATAEQIAKLEIKHVTYKTQIEREIKTVPVYTSAGCNHSDDGLRIVNAALTNGAEPASGLAVPSEPWAAAGREFRGDSSQVGGSGRDILQVPSSGNGG